MSRISQKVLACILALTIAASYVMLAGCAEKKTDAKEIDAIFKAENETELVIAMYDYLYEKCEHEDNMEALSAPERTFYVVQLVEMEVNSGGFDSLFFNSSGAFANEIADAFTEIGANATAEICKRALDAFGGSLPADVSERRDKMEEAESYETKKILNECDEAFYEYKDNLTELSYEYVMSNKESFT